MPYLVVSIRRQVGKVAKASSSSRCLPCKEESLTESDRHGKSTRLFHGQHIPVQLSTPGMPSDIRVFVRFKEQCAFAGEELNCVITFKNVAEAVEPPTPGAGPFGRTKRNSISQLAAAQAAAATNARLGPPDRLQNARSPSAGHNDRPQANRHRASYSLSNPSTPIPRNPSPSDEPENRAPQHQRSVSIISGQTPLLSPPVQDAGSGRPHKPGHRRSSTVQLSGMCLIFFVSVFLTISQMQPDAPVIMTVN